MLSRYVDADAAAFVASLRGRDPRASEELALRTYTARLLGADPSLVLHGGGNTSVKATATTALGQTVDVIHVKGSGWDLATIEPAGHPAVRMAPLLELRALSSMSDEAMVNALRLALLDASAPTPSVETLLHAWLPAKYIDHTHADAVLALADQPDAARVCRDAFGPSMVFVPYTMPGFGLAVAVAAAWESHTKSGAPPATVIVLEKHGVFTFGDTAKESYARMIAAVSEAERIILDHSKTQSVSIVDPSPALEARVLPRLRGALAEAAGEPPERGPILALRDTPAALAFLERSDAHALVDRGCITPDHVIRTKPKALLLDAPRKDDAPLRAQLGDAVAAYAKAYDAYFAKMCAGKGVSPTKLDPWPRVVLLPGVGICAVGKTKKEASVAADVYEHTLDVMASATCVGRYEPVSMGDLFDVEYWSLEQAKLKKAAEEPLAGKIALVTGAASGIGLATATLFAERGAHVLLVDRDAAHLDEVLASLAKAHGAQAARCAADVTDDAQVRAAVEYCVRAFGGLDVLVSNAGSAPEGKLETAAGEEALRHSLELNLVAHNHAARASVEVMAAQGRGGCLLFNASKSAFNPGPGFGPYAVAKAGLVALMRQYAVDLGKAGIRSNAVNADRIRTRLFEGGVLESRAKARGLSVDQYFRANLLEREVAAADVAEAFAYLATARATTGCVLTVDGGNAAAFPR
jgi:rhamnose utilization protein RhaD (predicted bifunctional aldolase and dehydrogenase)/NAD(P)-dependent dehydrogenase (short-subunit alcohol dehydrogenase family)